MRKLMFCLLMAMTLMAGCGEDPNASNNQQNSKEENNKESPPPKEKETAKAETVERLKDGEGVGYDYTVKLKPGQKIIEWKYSQNGENILVVVQCSDSSYHFLKF